jgi:hypothetical protein
MFEWNNFYGLNSKNPLYKEFKQRTIESMKKWDLSKGFNNATKFIVDSEVIDK